MSIPKIIHYCWFGRGDKPKIIKKCIESWKNKLEGYEIKEWNEENFNIEINEFVKEAYLNKKFAFVSDYVRVYALYNFGGIYLDTDVEVLKDFNDYLEDESFWGFEAGDFVATSTIGAQKGNKIIKQFLDEYKDKSFYKEDGTLNTITNVQIVSNIFKSLGVRLDGKYQKIERIGSIYPMEIFSPYDYRYYENLINRKTVTVHHYYKSWISRKDKVKQLIKKSIIKLFGVKFIKIIYER
ncbi:MAG: glycosyltransferase family 32 protein [Clostridium sp.]|uniref:glycosyltransferase family 32 protein n=1 Tax=Clostridium sp. TaxID=1506 RepID=UPI003F2B34FF